RSHRAADVDRGALRILQHRVLVGLALAAEDVSRLRLRVRDHEVGGTGDPGAAAVFGDLARHEREELDPLRRLDRGGGVDGARGRRRGSELRADVVLGIHGHGDFFLYSVTFSTPLRASIRRASSGVAICLPRSSTTARIFSTCWALLVASSPLPIQRLSSSPTRTWPPSQALCVPNCIWPRPAAKAEK